MKVKMPTHTTKFGRTHLYMLNVQDTEYFRGDYTCEGGLDSRTYPRSTYPVKKMSYNIIVDGKY
jgi:hypothetical protein